MSAGLTPLDLERPPPFGVTRRLVALLGLAAVVAAWVQTGAATSDLAFERHRVEGVPIEVLAPREVAAPAPGVVVAHGFAGSGRLMRSTAVALASEGYVVAVPDLAGHGANRSALPTDDGAGVLAAEVGVAVDVLADHDDVDPQRLGALGHSMGAGAVMDAAIRDPARIGATVAVSPTDAPVTAEVPADLLLLAGEHEPRFVQQAEQLLERAGGVVALDDEGPARRMSVVPGVEHVTILFSATMQRAAVEWFDATLGEGGTDRSATDGQSADEPGANDEQEQASSVPRLGLWWLVHLLGVVAVWRAVAPLVVDRADVEVRRGRPLLGLLVGGAVALGVLTIVDAVVDLAGVGGMLVGPVLVLWLALTGAVWLRVGDRPSAPSSRELLWALVVVALLYAAVGALAPRVWSPVWPDIVRVGYVPAFALGALPFTLAFATSCHGRRGWRGVRWYLVVGVLTLALVWLAATMVPALSFVTLVLPLLPLGLGVAMLVWSPLQRPWAAAVATAVLVGWLSAVTLPLT